MTEKKKGLTRRALLKGTGLAALGFTIVPSHVLGGKKHTAPSEQLTHAVIGVGGMGKGHLGLGDTRLLAVCDVDKDHMNEAIAIARDQHHADPKGYRDFRELLQRDDIDIIHIATPPHWHGLISIAAAKAGKDIWCEKPMTRTIAEGQGVVDAVQRHGRIFRINTWFRLQGDFYGSGASSATLKKIVQSGVLGSPVKFVIGAATGFDWKLAMWSGRTDLVPQKVPAQLDYDMWLGPAPEKPYHPHRVHQSFRGYWDYDGGGLGDMGMHYIDPVQYILGKDNESPVEIEANGPQQHPDAVSSWRTIRMKYADGTEIILDGAGDIADPAVLEGPKGKVYKDLKSTIPDLKKKIASMPELPPLETDFIACVKSRKKFGLNEVNGHRSCTLVNLAKIAIREPRLLRFDGATQRFVGDEAANRLIEEPMRAPWRVDIS